MIKAINFNDFVDEFEAIRPDNFSYEGLKLLFEHLEELEMYELDAIALCCEFTEYEGFDELEDYYGESVGIDRDDYDDDLDYVEDFLEELMNRTTVLYEEDTYIVGE